MPSDWLNDWERKREKAEASPTERSGMAIEIRVKKSTREDFGDLDLIYVYPAKGRKAPIAFSEKGAAMRFAEKQLDMLTEVPAPPDASDIRIA